MVLEHVNLVNCLLPAALHIHRCPVADEQGSSIAVVGSSIIMWLTPSSSLAGHKSLNGSDSEFDADAQDILQQAGKYPRQKHIREEYSKFWEEVNTLKWVVYQIHSLL